MHDKMRRLIPFQLLLEKKANSLPRLAEGYGINISNFGPKALADNHAIPKNIAYPTV
jgi:hypothetical protein